MELLYKYKNGNVTVTLFKNGTRVQEWDDDESPFYETPLSMDIKITNKCDLGCAFCHEMSVPNGENADLNYLFDIIKDLPKGTELALGGGNPLENVALVNFLEKCKSSGFVPSMTINSNHIFDFQNTLNCLIEEKLIYGLGISIDDNFDFNLLNLLNNTKNVVLHVIAGANKSDVLNSILNKSKVKKVLVLGYKDFGRGLKYHSEMVDLYKTEWFNSIEKYINKLHLSFDNLGVNQLQIRRFLNDEQWNSFYQGADGLNTMYIDAVKKEFAISSVGVKRFPLVGKIDEIFKVVQKESNNG